jgi:hypothetical protein
MNFRKAGAPVPHSARTSFLAHSAISFRHGEDLTGTPFQLGKWIIAAIRNFVTPATH